MPRRRIIHLVLVVAFALANVLQAAAGDRAGRAHARGATPTIAVATPSIPQAAPPRLKAGDLGCVLGDAFVDPAPSTAGLTPSRAGSRHGARASRLEFLRRAPAGCRPPPRR